jgi:hypothetical protein
MSIRKVNTVKIGHVRYKIFRALQVDDDCNAVGIIKHCSGEIGISTKLTSEDAEAHTIMHEVLHGLYQNAGVKKHDERTIEVISGMLIRLIQDNPKLIEAIQKLK